MGKIKKIIKGVFLGGLLFGNTNIESGINKYKYYNQGGSDLKNYTNPRNNMLPEQFYENYKTKEEILKEETIEKPNETKKGEKIEHKEEKNPKFESLYLEVENYLTSKNINDKSIEDLKFELFGKRDIKDFFNSDDKNSLYFSQESAIISNSLYSAAKNFNVNPKLLHAMAIVESSFGNAIKNKKGQIKSHKGALGVLQVMPRNIKYYSKSKNDFEAACNIIKEIGRIFNIDVSFSSQLTVRDIVIIGAAYNAGSGSLKNNPKEVLFSYQETNIHCELLLYAMQFKHNIVTNIERKNNNIVEIKKTILV